MDENFRRKMAGQKAGAAIKFTDIDGIGPATAKKIKNTRTDGGKRVQGPKQVADMSADELSDKAGISRDRAAKAIKGGGGNPNRSKRSSTGSTSTAGMRTAVGDFMVGFADQDKARARNDVRTRSEEAVRQDERRRAPVTTDLERWKNNKSGLDFPGVDTPTQNPNLLPKDLKQKQQPDTTDFEARDERERERQQQSYPRKTDAASGKRNFILETGDERIPASERTSEAMGVDEFGMFTEARDVSLDPDEAFNFTGAVSPWALGGNDEVSGGEQAPKRDLEKPSQTALRRQQRKQDEGIAGDDSDEAGIAFIFENTETDLSLPEFRRRTKRVGREIGLSDGFGNAQMVANDPDILSNL